MAKISTARRASFFHVGQPAASLALALTWSWAWWGVAIAAGGTETVLGGLSWLAGGFGPTVGVFSALKGQTAEYRKDFRRRLINWHFWPLLWLAAIVFAVGPKLISLGIGALGGHTPSGESISLAEIPVGLIFSLIVVWIEEPLWRGTALDAFRFASVKAALIIGMAWSLWHVPLFAVEGTFQQDELGLGTLDFAVFSIGVVGLSVFLTWIVGRTGSILIAMFTHIAINMNGMLLPDDTTIRSMEMALIWVVAAILIVWKRAWAPPIADRQKG